MRWSLGLLLTCASAWAHNNGVTGYSGQYGGVSCSDCHSGGPTPQVTLSGPTTLNVGEVGPYQLLIQGGAAVVGGLDVSVQGGGTLLPGPGQYGLVGEITHAQPGTFSNGQLAFTFWLQAPAFNRTLTMFAAGNSCDGDGTNNGDMNATTTLDVSVIGGPDAGAVVQIPADTDAGGAAELGPLPAGCSSGGLELGLAPIAWALLALTGRQVRHRGARRT